jgi:hypothetical protein
MAGFETQTCARIREQASGECNLGGFPELVVEGVTKLYEMYQQEACG